MARPPFKLTTPAAKNVNAPAPRPVFNQAETAKHAAEEGETLFEAGVENQQPDYDIGSATPVEAGQNHGENHAQRPTYKPAIPWPESKPVAHKPFKI
jgi:hypothetical protein